MSELLIPKIEKQDIKAPEIETGGTSIVFQRHERYQRDQAVEGAGSLIPADAEAARLRDLDFFRDILKHDTEGSEAMILFVSSDTQYADGGRRSLETGQLAQDAATEAMTGFGINPKERIINLNPQFKTDLSVATDQNIRPVPGFREPQIYDTPEYVDHLRDKYGKEDGPGNGLSQKAWAAHEADAEKDVRETMGAEGVDDILDRTKQSLAVLERYARIFHANNPGKRLIIWTTSHYDTISPLVKDATGATLEDYVPVDYGAGIVIDIPPKGGETTSEVAGKRIKLELGATSVRGVMRRP